MDRGIRTLVTAGVMGAIFIAALDTTIVAAAMPRIAADLGGQLLYSWPLAIYLVASTATVPLYGRLADSHGRRRLFLAAIGIFLLGSLLCGLAPTMELLVAARLVQGLGAGGILPLALTVAGDLYDLETRARIQGLFSSVWALASILGPLVGGGIVDWIGWRWVFLLNLPFGAASAAMLYRFHRDRPREGAPGRPDFAGAAALTLGLAALLVALVETGRAAWPTAGAALLVAILLGVTFVRREARAASPLVDTGILRVRVVAASNAVGFLAGGLLFALATFVPLWVHEVRGGSSIRAGFALTPMSLGWLTGAWLVGRLVPRTGYRVPILAGLVAIAVGSGVFPNLSADSPELLVHGPMAAVGLGLGLALTATLVAVQNSVGRHRLGQATSSVAFFRSIGGVFGVSVAGCVQIAALRAAGASPGTASADALATSLVAAFAAAFVFAAGALAAGLLVPGGRTLASEEARADQAAGEAAEPTGGVRGWPEGPSSG
jgi:EmrB/QacA subfamily drug resistance transporter